MFIMRSLIMGVLVATNDSVFMKDCYGPGFCGCHGAFDGNNLGLLIGLLGIKESNTQGTCKCRGEFGHLFIPGPEDSQRAPSCYKPYPQPLVEIHEAHSICKMSGGHLVDIQTKREQDHVTRMTRANHPQGNMFGWYSYWTSGQMIGGKWIWTSTNENIGETFWAEGEPSTIGGFIHMEAETGIWRDIYAMYKFAVLCEQEAVCFDRNY